MRTTAIFSALLPLLTLTTALPQSSNRAPNGDYTLSHTVCRDSSYEKCREVPGAPWKMCKNYLGDMSQQVSSFKFPEGTLSSTYCELYSVEDCFGDMLTVHPPGVSNLRKKRFDNKAKSFKCYYKVPVPEDWA